MTTAADGPAVLRLAAFADAPGGGNPAGVVLDAEDLDEATMLAVAADVGYSETAFVVARRDERDVDLRYFSPRAEVAFCGHATIATAVALAERHGTGAYRTGTPAGVLDVATRLADDGLVATITSVPTRTRPATEQEATPLLAALGWDLEALDPALPLHVAHAGNDHPVVAVRTRALLAGLDPDAGALEDLMADRGWTTVQVVFRQDPATFHSRNPFLPGGVPEDPATGAAALALGGYLRALGLAPADGRVVVLQGADMGRPSRLLVDTATGDDRVRVSGGAVPVEDGPVVRTAGPR